MAKSLKNLHGNLKQLRYNAQLAKRKIKPNKKSLERFCVLPLSPHAGGKGRRYALLVPRA
eukprot:4769587-Pyramimonas_sp.AAC.1